MDTFFEHILLFFTYLGVGITLFLIVLLAKKETDKKSSRVLIGILISFLVVFLMHISIKMNNEVFIAHMVSIGLIVTYLLGPLLLYYIRLIYQPQLKLGRSFLIHLIPFFIGLLSFGIPLLVLFWSGSPQYYTFLGLMLPIPILGVVSLLCYVYFCFKLFRRFKRAIKKNYASFANVDLNWLKLWIRGIIFFIVFDFVSSAIVLVFPTATFIIHLNVIYLVGLIWYVGYYGIRQNSVFLVEYKPKEIIKSESIQKKSLASSFKNQAEIENLKTKLNQVFENEKIFRIDTISLRGVAVKINTTDKKLSELINKEMSSSFYKYVNEFRLADFKAKVESGMGKDLTLLALAYESGFNSKATFNRFFKEQTGKTPSEFKKEVDHN